MWIYILYLGEVLVLDSQIKSCLLVCLPALGAGGTHTANGANPGYVAFFSRPMDLELTDPIP